MRPFFKAAALLLAVLTAASLLTSCQKGNDFTCADVINRGAGQQRWLKAPGSNLVINPNAVESNTDSRDMKAMPLSFGIKDASGKVVAAYEDALFLLEGNYANDGGLEILETINWDDCKGLSKIENFSSGSTLAFAIPEDYEKGVDVKPNGSWKIDYNDKKLFLSVNVEEIPEGSTFYFNPYVTDTERKHVTFATWTEPGYYRISLRDCAEAEGITILENGNDTQLNLWPVNSGTYRLSDFSLIRIASGYHPAEKDPLTEWAPYYMKSTVLYPNNTSIAATDFFYQSNVLIRKISSVSAGDIALAGKIYGSCTYDNAKNALIFDNGASRYVIFLKRKGTVEYYATYEDLLSGQKVLDSADGAAYWALPVTVLEPSEAEDDNSAFNVTVAASDTMSVSELLDAGTEAGSYINVKKAYLAYEEYWDSYIAENDVSEYITVFPEAK